MILIEVMLNIFDIPPSTITVENSPTILVAVLIEMKLLTQEVEEIKRKQDEFSKIARPI
jgi:hypothetical protein